MPLLNHARYDAFGNLAAEYGATNPAVTGTVYLTQDHLGGTRVISGSQMERLDFFFFGDQITVPQGSPRATVPGYSADLGIREKFTGKERDAETGLDYFGARYLSSAQGRFMSPDPLLNSGRPSDPQSWNRYSYVRNNPLSNVDPTGLYDWSASGCISGDKECGKEYKAHQREFKDALSYLKAARDSYDKKSGEYGRLDAALSAYGKEGDHNGVSVAFGALKGPAAGETTPLGDMKSFAVTLDPAKWTAGADGAKFLASDVGHEGTHVSDLGRVFAGGGTLSDFSLEYRGYQTSAYVFQGLFTPALGANQGIVMGGVTSRSLGHGGNVIWNTSWSAADKAAIQSRDVGITNVVKSLYGHQEAAPHNPWGN